jgi:hypothetical protein
MSIVSKKLSCVLGVPGIALVRSLAAPALAESYSKARHLAKQPKK